MSKVQYIGIKEEGQAFRVVSRDSLMQELNTLPKGKYRLTIEKYRKNKSNPQLGYLFACVYVHALKALNDAGWEFTSVDEVDHFFKSRFANKDLVNRHTGEVMEIPALKRDMTTTELSTYTNSVRDWCSEYLNYFIPDPETQTQFNL